MTKKEFISNALLQLLGNSEYGKCGWHSSSVWASEIYSAIDKALEIAEHYKCLDEEPGKPP